MTRLECRRSFRLGGVTLSDEKCSTRLKEELTRECSTRWKRSGRLGQGGGVVDSEEEEWEKEWSTGFEEDEWSTWLEEEWLSTWHNENATFFQVNTANADHHLCIFDISTHGTVIFYEPTHLASLQHVSCG